MGGPVFSWHVLSRGRVLESRESGTEKVAPEAEAKFSRSVVWKGLSNPREKLGGKHGHCKIPTITGKL